MSILILGSLVYSLLEALQEVKIGNRSCILEKSLKNMETRLLSVCRVISTINADLKIPDTSVVAVNIDREN